MAMDGLIMAKKAMGKEELNIFSSKLRGSLLFILFGLPKHFANNALCQSRLMVKRERTSG